MAVEVVDVRKVVVIGWDTEVVQGKTASIQANGTEIRVVLNDGQGNIYYPLDWTGSTEITVQGSKSGTDSGTIEVTGEESGSGDGGGPDGGGEPDVPVDPGNGNGGGDEVGENTASYVFYNDGEDPNVYAIVTQDNGDETFNLYTLPAQGTGVPVNAVPRREPEDYGPEGGGMTWHLTRTE